MRLAGRGGGSVCERVLVLLIVYVALIISWTPDTIGLCLGSCGDTPCYEDCLLEIILLEICKLHPHWGSLSTDVCVANISSKSFSI